ncbi:MAG: methionine--tRNA ligase [Patescibacteria group bacterium]
MDKISIDDFHKVEIKIGEIKSAEKIEGSDKLLKLSVDFGEEKLRQVLSGIAKYVTAESLVGLKCPFITNLPIRVLMGLESQAMIMAASSDSGEFTLLKADHKIPPGTKIK